MSSSEKCFPFDGTCELSKDADFTLTFDDESCLKTSKCLLELASPVFKTAIRECEHEDTLHLSETSRDTWVLILNYLHPAGQTDSHNVHIAVWVQYPRGRQQQDMVIDILKQCEKFGFKWLKVDVDKRLANQVNTMCSSMSGEPSSNSSEFILVNSSVGVFAAVKEFELPKCEEALASYLARVHTANRECSKRRISRKRKTYGQSFCSCARRISYFINEMQSRGHYRLGSLLARAILEEDISISQGHAWC